VRDQAQWPACRRPLLVRDHERLEALLTRLLDRLCEGYAGEMRAMWARFEMRLSAHLGAEERYLLPLFARVGSEEAAELLTEHAVFRKAMEDLGAGVDSHAVSLDVARGFVGALRAHADRETKLFYRWAERQVRNRVGARWRASWT